jgi:hypothetical protein
MWTFMHHGVAVQDTQLLPFRNGKKIESELTAFLVKHIVIGLLVPGFAVVDAGNVNLAFPLGRR